MRQRKLSQKERIREYCHSLNQDKTEIVGYCMLSVDDKGYGGLGPIGIAKNQGKNMLEIIF